MVRELDVGGCERDLAKLARCLDRKRFEPHVGCFRAKGLRADELRDFGVPIVRFPVTSFRSPSFIRGVLAFRKYVRDHGIRLVHSFDVPTNVFGVAAARLTGLRPIVASQLWFLDTISRQFWQLHRLSLRFADAVLVNSDAVRRQLLSENAGLADRIHVSHNGVETNVFSPGERWDSAPGSAVVIGAVCALRPEKRLDLLIDAFARVQKQIGGVELLIVGSGEMLPGLERQSTDLGIRDHCIFQPARSDVVPWMRGIDVFVVCSDSESFPNALLEAMACGCCVIGSNVGGIPELIHDGQSGLLFERGNASELAERLTSVVSDAELRNRLSRNAAKRACEQFSMEAAVARMERLYNTLL